MVDIVEGDILVVESVEYPIKYVGDWAMVGSQTPSFLKMAVVDCSTKRSPGVDGDGHVGEAVENLTDLYATPLDPASGDLVQRLNLETSHELLETFIADNTEFVHLIIEDLKR